MYNVVVAGGRDFDNFGLLCDQTADLVERLVEEGIESSEICFISADCEGADRLSKLYSNVAGYRHLHIPILWGKYGEEAWKVANTEMASLANELIVFWDGESLGTKDMIERIEALGLKVTVVNYDK